MSVSPNSLAIQRRLQKAEHYNRWIYEAIRADLGRRILDVGCAVGNVTRRLLESDPELVIGLDADPAALAELERSCGGNRVLRTHCLDVTSAELTALTAERLDTITCLNFLEHIEDDRGLLRSFWQLLEPGGRLILLVPAFPWLYGSMDAADHHLRRYRRHELELAITAAGFSLRRTAYMNMLGVAGWYLNGVVLRRRLLPARQLGLFDRLVPLLRKLEGAIGPPFGQSIIAVAERP
ncbi:MAG: methyltransferase domain-containing protein [Deltaproteobacteria bacterium]|nr:methyltransferase domain-containing protein [Deltaproteobacteria bacterium]